MIERHVNHIPQIISETLEGDIVSAEFAIQSDSDWFDGHFPDMPVLPAVAQIGLAVELAGRFHGAVGKPKSVVDAKFFEPIIPPAEMTITVILRRDGFYDFTVESSVGQASKGRLGDIHTDL